MKNTIIKRKDIEHGQREYRIKVYRPYGANELPCKDSSLQDLIAVGVLPIRRLVDTLEQMLEDNLETEAEGVIVEQIRRLVTDLEEALYRYDDGVMWNVSPELEKLFEKIESIPKEKLPEIHKAIEPFLLKDPKQEAA